uniref:Large ribosomal subunit protein uL18m n=1 Tax=Plectus sambesii TaxID=2011161 RepID=A0A914XM51_9BILA
MSRYMQRLVVRNPRNMERMGYQRIPTGYQFEKNREHRSFIYRAELESSHKATTGHVRHYQNGLVVSASTREWPIAKQLYSTNDVSAAMNIGRVLASRCLQYGIHFALKGVEEDELKRSERLRAFFEALEEGGLVLQEPPAIEHTYQVDRNFYWEQYPLNPDKDTT